MNGRLVRHIRGCFRASPFFFVMKTLYKYT